MPEHFSVTPTDTGIHVNGFPDAEKLIRLTGPKAKQLADLSLHIRDLQFALDCLKRISGDTSSIENEALWRCAIIHFCKCFGSSKSRGSLSSGKIYKGEPEEAFLAFKHFDSLRNKHLIHDENSYAQCVVGAVLNNATASYKIEKIITLDMFAVTLQQGDYGNLHLLIEIALKWAGHQYDELAQHISRDMEKRTREELKAMPDISLKAPEDGAVHHARSIDR